MRTLVEAVCASCGVTFLRQPAFLRRRAVHYCSRACGVVGRRGQGSPLWKGEEAGKDAGRRRARTAFATQPCAECGATVDQIPIHRHHVDGDTLNNDPSNIRFLCARHHQRTHRTTATHCRHGHPYTPENTRVNKRGHRKCLTCLRALEARRVRVRTKRAVAP